MDHERKGFRKWFSLAEAERMRLRYWVRFFVLSSLLFVVVMGITFAIVIRSPQKVTLPNFMGQNVVKVMKRLQKRGLRLYVYEKPSSDVLKGHVISQVPHPGTLVKEGRTVLLTLSQGRSIGRMPDFIGRPYMEAKQEMLKLFEGSSGGVPLNIMRIRRLNETVPEGLIIEQSPAARSALGSNKDVVFIVSSGDMSSRFEVKSYRWRSYAAVKKELEKAGIDVFIKKRYTFNGAYVNRIFLQTVPTGRVLYEGDTIGLYVGIAVDEMIIDRDLMHVEVLRVYDFDVPIRFDESGQLMTNEEGRLIGTRHVTLYVVDTGGKQKVLEEDLLQGSSVKLPYKSVGKGSIEIYLEGEFFTRIKY